MKYHKRSGMGLPCLGSISATDSSINPPQGPRLSTKHWCYHLQCIGKGSLAQSMDISFMDVLKLTVGDSTGGWLLLSPSTQRSRGLVGVEFWLGVQSKVVASPTIRI